MREREPTEDAFPTIMIKDSETEVQYTHVIPKKGLDSYAVKRIVQDIERNFGYKKFILKIDQEPAIMVLKEAIIRHLKAGHGDQIQVLCEESPVGESQSNGSVENGFKQLQGQFRTIRAHVETKLKSKLPEGHAIWPWLIKHCSDLLNRYNVGKDGKTPRYRLKGKKFKRDVVDYAECVWYLKPKSKGKDKLNTRWESGIWLGIREESGEVIVGTDE